MKSTAKTAVRHAEDLRFHLLSAARSAKAIEDAPIGARVNEKARRLKEAAASLRRYAGQLEREIRGR